MRVLPLAALVVLLSCGSWAQGESSEPLMLARAGKALATIVAADRTGVAGFAAAELKQYLDRVTGAVFRVSNKQGAGPSIFVGDCAQARAAGLDVSGLKRDGFFRAVRGGHLFLLGRDHKGRWRMGRHLHQEHATVFAVYDFLEDVCGVRWIKAGPYGEVVPTRRTLAVACETVREEPVFLDRRLAQANLHHYKYPDAAKHATRPEGQWRERDRELWALRLRYGTLAFGQGCHSSTHLKFGDRFGGKHPEWFALKQNGERAVRTPRGEYLCYSHPGVIDAFIQDARAYFTGQPPGSRGLTTWRAGGYGDEFCVDPNDSYLRCQCEQCVKAFKADPSLDYSEVIFGAVAKVADGIKDLKGKAISTLAYGPKRLPPRTVRLPANVHLRLCVRGPYEHTLPATRAEQLDLVREWSRRRQGQLALWLYPNRANYQTSLHGAVETEPHAIGAFLKAAKPYVIGAFFENEAVCQTYRFLDEYVMLKLLWNPDQDVDALLADTFASFYGPAAGDVRALYAELERLWLRVYTLHGGDRPRFVGRIDLWEKIYSPEAIGRLDAMIGAAAKRAAGHEAYAWRVALLRDELVGRIKQYRADYEKTLGVAKQTQVACRRAPAEPAPNRLLPDEAWRDVRHERLGPLRRRKAKPHGLNVLTHFKTLWSPKFLHLRIRAEEPDADKSATFAGRQPDDPSLWKDQTVEFMVTFFDAQTMAQSNFQILVNDRGVVSDVSRSLGQSDWGWSSGATVDLKRAEGEFVVRVAVPWSAMGVADPLKLGPVAFNVVRHRVRRGMAPEYYSWSPVGWSDPDQHGQMTFAAARPSPAPVNLLAGGGLDGPGKSARYPLAHWITTKDGVGHASVDAVTRWDGAGAARLERKTLGTAVLLQYIDVAKLKPGAAYRLSCKVRLEGVQAGAEGRWPQTHGVSVNLFMPGLNVHVPAQAMTGTSEWRNVSFTAKTAREFGKKARAYCRLFLKNATGTAWFDEVELVEVTGE